ncbi:MAG: hypothetical protein ABFC24_03180 [Methanoregulaceae archaeon]
MDPMKDDAVAPVIAVLLILAVIATFVAVWNATALPSLKEQSEMEHLHSVETSFTRFSSDIESAVSLRQNGLTLSEPVQLGGGDVIFNNVRSGGSLRITNEEYPLYTITLGSTVVNGTLVTISYEPSGNFWQDQGYRWQNGYINVTKHSSGRTPLQTPLFYATMGDVGNGIPLFGAAGKEQSSGNCSIWVVNLSASRSHSTVSGNGIGTLTLSSDVSSQVIYSNVKIQVQSSSQSPFRNETLGKWNSSLNRCFGTIITSETDGITISSANVSLTFVNISVGAY